MSAGDRGDPRQLSPQGQPSLTGTGHPVHAFVLPRRSVRAAEWYQSEPPAPCGVQTAACVKPSPPAGGGGCRRKAAGGASRNACLWTNLRSPRGCGANTERFLALRFDRSNHLGARGVFSVVPQGGADHDLHNNDANHVRCLLAGLLTVTAACSLVAEMRG